MVMEDGPGGRVPVILQDQKRFSLPNLRFGKLDIGRWPKEAERFRVNAHPTSRQLPTICLFKDAKELKRRPLVNESRRAIPFVFNQDNCILEFDLLNIHKECLERLSAKERKEIVEEKKTRARNLEEAKNCHKQRKIQHPLKSDNHARIPTSLMTFPVVEQFLHVIRRDLHILGLEVRRNSLRICRARKDADRLRRCPCQQELWHGDFILCG
ncbi:hypothetical protein ANCDUO_18734 [Ancylostoma duodenale]|uniref:Uncharacterized protein n=1 Tax=Ancylostoma duodenale TaxID=51022 RepID=A0A0C2CN62_9BILA|nr:hypothetical protein ANCDUO_18734 [Ancylostoma duodenale]